MHMRNTAECFVINVVLLIFQSHSKKKIILSEHSILISRSCRLMNSYITRTGNCDGPWWEEGAAERPATLVLLQSLNEPLFQE